MIVRDYSNHLKRRISVSPNRYDYREIFKKEKEVISTFLSNNTRCIFFVSHVGSTSINNVNGKPVVDVAIGCRNERCKKIIKYYLNKLPGYFFVPSFSEKHPGRYFFFKGGKYKHIVHLHLVDVFGGEWFDMHAYKYGLENHRSLRIKYVIGKKKYALNVKNISEYADLKIEILTKIKSSILEELGRKKIFMRSLHESALNRRYGCYWNGYY